MNQDVIKIFVGCDPNNCDLEQMMVLEYSIRKHTQATIDIVWMQLSRDPNSFWYANPETQEGWNSSKWVTTFSGFRWGIPAYCGYAGKAIYMDADVLVLSDISELWHHPINPESMVAAKGAPLINRLCVSLWDCAKAREVIPSMDAFKRNPDNHYSMVDQIKAQPSLITPFNDSYNCLDGEDLALKDIKILHYTDIGTQFSHPYSIPRLKAEGSQHWYDGQTKPHWREDLVALFAQYYEEALAAGYTLEQYRVTPFGNVPKESLTGYHGDRFVDVHHSQKKKPSKIHKWQNSIRKRWHKLFG